MALKVVWDFTFGVDSVTVTKGYGVTDTVTGSDSVTTAIVTIITDSATGTDSVTSVGSDNSAPILSDLATGTDDVNISVSFGLNDRLNLSENLSDSLPITIITVTDTASGIDVTGIGVAIQIDDNATGNDVNSSSAPDAKSATDTITGTDTTYLTLLKTVTDTSVVTDLVDSTLPSEPTPSTPSEFIAVTQTSTLPAYVELFEIDCTNIPEVGVIYYVTPNINGNNTKVVFGGTTYEPYPIQISGFEQSSDGAPPRPTLSIGNLNLLFGMLTFLFEDIVGAKVIYYRTFSQYLALGDKISAPPLKFFIGKKVSHTIQSLSWELRTPLDKERSFLPKRQMLKRDFPGLGINKAVG